MLMDLLLIAGVLVLLVVTLVARMIRDHSRSWMPRAAAGVHQSSVGPLKGSTP